MSGDCCGFGGSTPSPAITLTAGVDVEDEGVNLGTFTTLNFVGDGVTAANAGGGVATITIPADADGVFSPPEAWFVTEIAAGASGDMGALVSQNFSTVQLIRAGSVVGLSVRFTGPITAGVITITVTLNGVPTALSVNYTAPSTGSVATWPIGTLNYAAGDELGLSYSATGTLEPDRTLNVEAWLELTESL